MAHPKRIYTPGEQPHNVFSQLAGQNRFNRYFYLKTGKILDIDYDHHKMKIEWVAGGSGSPDWVPISHPYVGPAGCIAAMPEVGALGLFGYVDQGKGIGTPFLLCFLPVALEAALDHNWVKVNPDSIPSEDDNLVFMKFRKLQKGDLTMASMYGGEIFVNKDVEIKNGSRDTILLRGSDQSIIMTSLHNFVFSSGATVSAGPIMRNMVNIFDHTGNRIPNQLARELSLPDGREHVYLVPSGAAIDENTQFYSEYRIDVEDIVDSSLDINDINSQSAISTKDPIVTLAMGNYAGGIKSLSTYGKILRPSFFTSSADIVGQFNLLECVQNKGQDEVGLLEMAYAVHILKKNAFMGFDKEGQFYLAMGTSTSANPTGAGRSMSMLAAGSLKEIWGANSEDANSWDLSTKGGIRWNIGSHNAQSHGRSIEIKTSSSIYVEARNNDVDGFAKQEIIHGNESITVAGTSLKQTGSSTLIVDGLKVENVTGSATFSCQSDYTVNTLGVYTLSVSKEMQGHYDKRKETVNKGQELEIKMGDDKETIDLGNKKTSLTAGNIEETITAGNRKTSITAGNYTVSVTVGKIEISSTAGDIKFSTTTNAQIQGLIKVDVKGAQVNLGMVATGGVITTTSHTDYICGIPLKSSNLVKSA